MPFYQILLHLTIWWVRKMGSLLLAILLPYAALNEEVVNGDEGD